MAVHCNYALNEYVSVSNIDLSGNDELTLCCFVSFNNLLSGPRRMICSAWGTSMNQNWALLGGDDYIQFRVATGTGTASYIDTGNILSINTWYHVAGVYDGSDMYIYVDGAQEATAGKTGNVRNVTGSETALFTDPKQAADRDMYGTMYDVRIYDRALSLAEIQIIHKSNGADGIFSGCRHRWRMDEFYPDQEISGSDVIKDEIGGYHGTGIFTPLGAEGGPNRRRY